MIDRANSIEAQAYVGFAYTAQKQYFNECNHFYPDLEVIQGIPQGAVSYNVGGLPNLNEFPCPPDNPTCKDSCGGTPYSCGRDGGNCLSSLDKIEDKYGDSAPFSFKENSRSIFDIHYPRITGQPTYLSAMGFDPADSSSSDLLKVGRKHLYISAIKEIENSKWDVWTIDHRGGLTNAKVTVD